MKIRWEPVPGSKVAKADVHTARPVIAGHKPPNAIVEIPSRMDKDIVDELRDAATVDPNVFAVAVVPIPVDPNPARADRNLLLGHDDLRRRWGVHCGSDGLGLLDDDHGVPVNLRRFA